MTDPTSVAPPAASRHRLRNGIRVVVGLGLGLLIAEGAFRFRDKGAFPHLNIYVEDADRGVRLRPGASERIRFSDNPVTSVRINDEGYRGPAWPAPSADEVIVVGDSQVFGLGVEENETFSSVLQTSLGGAAVVRNLGVPTYGPREYNSVVEESLGKRGAKTVVYVVNLANDLFEATRPNKDRHAVWDGWAVRKETAPSSVAKFPGRAFLYTESHAFFALRGALYDKAERSQDQGFASEGTWRDIGDAATTAETERIAAQNESARLALLRDTQIKYAADSADAIARAVDAKVIGESYKDLQDDYSEVNNVNTPGWVPKEAIFRAARLNPGDIVTARNGEEARDIRVNAEHIRRGAALRLALEKKVRAQAQQQHDAATTSLFEKRDTFEKNAAELRASVAPKITSHSPLTPVIRDLKAICDKHGARLMVVALPIDVQVSKAEWAKYGIDPIDMESTKILLEDIVNAARAVSADGFDATPALTAAEPGAFLDGDIHMTPKGHRALGDALAKALRAPKLAVPGEGLPAARTPPPQPAEWTANTEIAVRESDPAGCETKKVREWLGVFCRHKGGAKGVIVATGIEVLAGALPGEALLVAPVIPGQDLRATFAFERENRDFVVKVGQNVETAELGFTKPLPEASLGEGSGPSAEASAFCTCFTAQNAGKTCSAATTVPDADCARTYAKDCAKLLACASGDPGAAPTCSAGHAKAGAARRCRALCSNEVPCAKGRCAEWQGGRVCM